ncbi:sentrin-specific protease 7b isoform X2 [Archocentrus centrarchus]|uniref:sentrin-specific protease 7b isoform X2 n=1 Tax=Archocentrus centrarchus TaxID=63155 RepID=UPI0011E9D81D|nr:uncharacterized protein LOC115795890 isoform X2 [Archocentrus centrarchus]
MASPFKIPKKKHPEGSDSSSMHMQSPLSRLQSSAPQLKGYGDHSGRGGADRTAVGASSDRQRTPCKPLFRDVVKTLLGLNSPNKGAASETSHRAAGRWSSQSQAGKRGESSSCLSNGWRPKRASDRLLQPESASEYLSPPQKKKASIGKTVSVDSVDTLAELRGDRHAGSLSSSPLADKRWRRFESKEDASEKKSDTGSPPESPLKQQKNPSVRQTPPSGVQRPSSATRSSSSISMVLSSRTTPDRKQRLDGRVRLGTDLKADDREKEKERWRQFREKNKNHRSAVLHVRLRNPKPKPREPSEPIVLSSEEEEEEEDGEGNGDGRVDKSHQGHSEKVQAPRPLPVTPPSFLQLEFISLHAGLTAADASGTLMITESGITIPVKGPPCPFVLLLLKEQLQELQAALLASILDMEEYKSSSSSSEGPAPLLDWASGLLLLHSCPPPVDQHLLRLLGHSTRSSQLTRSQRNKCSLNSAGLQQLPTRLIQYPVAPCKGRITVTKEDLACLGASEFLNDVIIDFYLKYLLLEGVGGSVAERSHVFSSFFYKQLSRRRAAGEDDAPSVPDRHTRHQRVKTWTRHVDIFTKDFLFVPVNQEAHWYLVVVCFPGLEEARYEEFQSRAGKSGAAGTPNSSLTSQQPPECSEQGWKKDTVLKRPCILVMDSLKLSYHDNVCRLIRDYLQVEWEVHRKSPRLFTSDSMKSFNCRVPQQDNSSDCGLYLLQYVESFLQNPVVHFDLPLRLESWFPRQRVRQKRQEIRSLIMKLHQSQLKKGEEPKASPSC